MKNNQTSDFAGESLKEMETENICMSCGIIEKERLEYITLDRENVPRHFCSDHCLARYYDLPDKAPKEKELSARELIENA